MIKYPGGEIAFWSVLFILAGAYVSYDAFVAGKTGLGFVFAVPAVACVLIWLDVRPAKWLVVAYLAVATIGAIGLQVAGGFTWSSTLRGVMAAYAAFQFAVWRGGPGTEDAGASPSDPP